MSSSKSKKGLWCMRLILKVVNTRKTLMGTTQFEIKLVNSLNMINKPLIQLLILAFVLTLQENIS